MTLRLIYSRPMAVYVADDEPQRGLPLSFLGRLVRLLFEALHRARANAAARELRRYRHLVHKDRPTAKADTILSGITLILRTEDEVFLQPPPNG